VYSFVNMVCLGTFGFQREKKNSDVNHVNGKNSEKCRNMSGSVRVLFLVEDECSVVPFLEI